MTEQSIDPNEAVRTGAHVIARTAQGQTYGEGRVIAYCDRPTFVIERPDGERFSWTADMVHQVQPEVPLVDLPDTGAIRLNDTGRILYFAKVGPGEVVTGHTLDEALAKREEGERLRTMMASVVEGQS